MARANDLLDDAFGRVRDDLAALLAEVTSVELLWRPSPVSNSIGWLVWHLTRVQDDHLAGVAEAVATGKVSPRVPAGQVWVDQGWAERFGLPYPPGAHGYGHSPAEVARFCVDDPVLLAGYQAAVASRTEEVLAGLTEADFDVIVDDRFSPPVTVAVRLVSVVNDITQHLGQAAYLLGLVRAPHA